jgi:hypothetical protein
MDTIASSQWRRIAALSFSLAGLILVVLVIPLAIRAVQEHKQRIAAQPAPFPANEAEQGEIVRAVLTEGAGLLMPPNERRTVILLNTTVAFCGLVSSATNKKCAALPSADSIAEIDLDNDIPRKLRLELIAANSSPVRVPDPQHPLAIYSSYSSIQEALKGPNSWDRFYATFPESAGLVEVSQAVLSQDKQYALIYVGNYAHGLAGRGFLHYLIRTGDTWRIRKSVGVWIS